MDQVLTQLIWKHLGHIPARRLLVYAFLLLLLTTIAWTTYLLVSGGNKILKGVMADAAQSTSHQLHVEVEHQISAVRIAGESLQHAIFAGYIDPTDANAILRFLWNLPGRKDNYTFSRIYFSTPEGEYTRLGVDLSSDKTKWRVGKASPKTDFEFSEFAVEYDGTAGRRLAQSDSFDARTRPWYQKALQSDTPLWTDVYQDAAVHKPVVTWTSAVRYSDHELLGIVGVDLVFEHMQHFVSKLPISKNSELFIVDAAGTLIAKNAAQSPAESTQLASIESSQSDILLSARQYHQSRQDETSHANGVVNKRLRLHGNDGYLHTSAVGEDAGLGWLIGVFIAESDYLSSIPSQLARVVPLSLLAVFLSWFVLNGFLGLVVRPLRQLKNGANKIAEGNFNTRIDTTCSNEVGQLASAIDSMRHRLKESFQKTTDQKILAEATLGSIPDGVMTIDQSGHLTYMNPAAERLTGWSFAKLTDRALDGVFHVRHLTDDTQFSVADCLQELGDSPERTNIQQQLLLRNKIGNTYSIDCNISEYALNENSQQGAVLVFSDITEDLRLQSELLHMATHDELTGLANRREFDRKLQYAVTLASRTDAEHVVCYMDLDQFKVVNDTCGHEAGDEMLRQVADLLRIYVRDTDTIARLGGDEFGLLLNQCSIEQASRIVESIMCAIGEYQFVWCDRVFSIGISIGMVSIKDGSAGTNTVLRDADLACYAAKDAGRNRMHIYSEEDTELAQRHEEMQWVNKIDQALLNDKFVLYAQAIEATDCSNSPARHYEVLVRMLDSNDNVLAPGVFLPAAERYNLAVKIDRWVIANTLKWLVSHPEVLASTGFLSINLSGQSLGDEQFLPFIQQQLKQSQVPAHSLCFEITESAAIANLSRAQHLMESLKQDGYRFALDDFGSGLSSFAYLKNLAVDFLKIDGVFVQDIVRNDLDFAMVRSINEIGQTMGMQTIAEFVESDAIRSRLREIGVDYVQGYGIGEPRPIEELALTENLAVRSPA